MNKRMSNIHLNNSYFNFTTMFPLMDIFKETYNKRNRRIFKLDKPTQIRSKEQRNSLAN